MLNYSEFGTEVNGQLFSCDFTDHPPTPATVFKQPTDDPQAFYTNVREIIDKRRGIIRNDLKFDRMSK